MTHSTCSCATIVAYLLWHTNADMYVNADVMSAYHKEGTKWYSRTNDVMLEFPTTKTLRVRTVINA